MKTNIWTQIFLVTEDLLNKISTSKYNPLYYHGALPQFIMYILFLSGLLLFAYYVPTIDNAYFSKNLVNAYTSVAYITNDIPFGAVIRAVHRYAGDAMVVAILIHMVRVWFTDRYRQYRWVQWESGIVLLLMVLFIGQTGYYLIWDERSLLLTRMTVSALEVVPVIGEPLRNWFLNGRTISNLTLSNFLFIHIGLSFSLLFALWIHYVRMSRPVITPPPALNYILMTIIFAVVYFFPITATKIADLNSQPTSMDIDVFFLLPYAVLGALGTTGFWISMILITAALCLIPYPFTNKKPVESAEVVDSKCTGCSFCFKDCPFQAIEMVPAPAGSRFKLLATVKPYRCSGCGVCVGACAFDAIDLPNLLDSDVNEKIKQLANSQSA
ncbi:cytochrome b N-terminal domain-containing protein [Candidatus Obscuribacterales bacterium]|nr:cytochrome b N-terminal domain-containing protein [Candidatus Obscuribacterales bacterium]MBX3136405.1 cytochrome b N-terminal domain-containing protein [Candidatus Obscuribacterales bacterium]MBX3153645.1 cytochrome b N-terminal domain-containing protein [Candidatus Obscuribacterales bacterium]